MENPDRSLVTLSSFPDFPFVFLENLTTYELISANWKGFFTFTDKVRHFPFLSS